MTTSKSLPGRHQQLQQLRQWIKDPSVHVIALTGAAGMGKSALLELLESQLEAEQLVLSHSCSGGLPLEGGALGGILARLNRLMAPLELAALLEEPGLRPLFSLMPSLSGISERAGFQFMPMLESLLALLGRLCRRRPVALIVDEVQDLDEASRALLEGLLAHPALDELPVTILVACRDLQALPFVADWQRLLGPMRGMQQLVLPPLDLAAVGELVARELDPGALQQLPGLPAELEHLSAGRPFLALHLLRVARRQGLVRATFAGWKADSLEALAAQASADLLGMVAAPLLARGPLARFLLVWLEVAGRAVSLEALSRASGQHEELWARLADELQVLGVLQSRTESTERLWSYSHALWAEAASTLLSPGERHELLLSLAEALESMGEACALLRADVLCQAWAEAPSTRDRQSLSRQAAELLTQLLHANPTQASNIDLRLRLAQRLVHLAPDAASYSLAVHSLLTDQQLMGSATGLVRCLHATDAARLEPATRLLWLSLMPRAFTLDGRAAELEAWLSQVESEPWPTTTERVALLLARLQRRYATSRWEGAQAEFQQVGALEGNPAQQAWARCLQQMMPLPERDDPAARFKLLEAEFASSAPYLDDFQRMAIYFELQNLAHLSGQRPLMAPHHPAMVELARRSSASSLRIHRDRLARALTAAGQLEEAEVLLRENLDHALRTGERAMAAEMAVVLVNLLRQQRRLEDALVVGDLLGEELEQGGTYTQRALLLTVLSICWRLHRVERAAQLLAVATRQQEAEPIPELRLAFLYSQAMVRLLEAEAGGAWSAAASAAQAMVDFYQELGRRDTEALIFALIRDRALCQLHGADPARRAADYLPAVEAAIARREYDLVRFLSQIGELALLTGEHDLLDGLETQMREAGRDEELAAAFRLSRAHSQGWGGAAARAMLELASHAVLCGQRGLVEHAQRRFPAVQAWPLPEALPARELCLFAWTQAECALRGLAFAIPGRSAQGSVKDQVREALELLGQRRQELAVDGRRRLDEELERLSMWLKEHGQGLDVRLELLGGPRLFLGGSLVDPGTLKTRVGLELLALLAVRAWQGQPSLSRDKVLDALSLNGRPLLSEGSLRVVVSRIRKGLQECHPEPIHGQDRQGYGLAMPVALDVAEFEEAWRMAQDALQAGQPGEAAHQFDACISLYRGPFLSGGAGWTDALRAHTERRLMDAVAHRLDLLEDEASRSAWLEGLRARLPELAEFLPA